MPVKEKIWLWAGDYKESFNIATRFGFDDRVLLFLKTDTRIIELKSTKEFPLALKFLKEDEIDAVELFPDETALQKYGNKGRFGVIVVEVRKEYLPIALTKLRQQKSIN